MLGPESRPSLGLAKTYSAMAEAKRPATEKDLKVDRTVVEFNRMDLLYRGTGTDLSTSAMASAPLAYAASGRVIKRCPQT